MNKAINHIAICCWLFSALVAESSPATGAPRDEMLGGIDARFAEHREIALRIWDLAELGYQEFESSALLQEKLSAAGFAVRSGVAGGTGIGIKGLQLAAKALALTAADLYENPELLRRARVAFERQRGADFVYTPLIGDREPPLDYRRQP